MSIHPCCQDIEALHQYSIQLSMVTLSVAVQYWNYQKTSMIKYTCHVIYKFLSRYDCGPVLSQQEYRISPAVTSEMLSCELADLGVEMVRMM